MLVVLVVLLAFFPSLTHCRVRHLMISSPPTLSSQSQSLLPPVPDMPVTACSPPPPAQCCCCVLAAVPPPAGNSHSMLYQLFVSTFGRICTGVLISGVIYVLYLAFCRCRRDLPRRRPPCSRGTRSSPHFVSGSEAQTPDQSPSPPPPCPFDIGTDPGLGDFMPDGFDIGF